MIFVARLVGIIAAFCFSVAVGNLIGGLVPSNGATAATGPLVDVARTLSVGTIRAPSNSGIELLSHGARAGMAFHTADAPSTPKEVLPAKAAPPPKATPPPQRRAPVRYAKRDADDGE
jgi:hypothetical protein